MSIDYDRLSDGPQAKRLSAIALDSLIIYAGAFIVAASWNNLFNTLFENIAKRFDTTENGKVELILRLIYALIITAIVAFLLRTGVKKYNESRKRKQMEKLNSKTKK